MDSKIFQIIAGALRKQKKKNDKTSFRAMNETKKNTEEEKQHS